MTTSGSDDNPITITPVPGDTPETIDASSDPAGPVEVSSLEAAMPGGDPSYPEQATVITAALAHTLRQLRLAAPTATRATLPSTPVHAGAGLRTGMALSDFSIGQLWIAYIALGGLHDPAELYEYVNGSTGWSPHEHDVAAHALNERCADLELGNPVSYAHELDLQQPPPPPYCPAG